MEHRTLGSTGLKVSILGFGGIPIKDVPEHEAVEVVNRALDLGIDFVHTSITYGDSAYKIGKVMVDRRDDCALAVKIGGSERTAEEAGGRLSETLEALNTDHAEIAELPVNAEGFPKAMGKGGAYEALQRARDEGVIDHIGITSHDVDFLEGAITTGKFSNVVMPFNYAASSAREGLIGSARRMGLGIIAMKVLGKGGLPMPSRALRYVLGHEIDTAIVGMNKVSEVEENIKTACELRKLTTGEIAELETMAEDIIRSDRLSSSGAVRRK